MSGMSYKSVEMGSNFHVAPNGNGQWSVRKTGATRASVVVRTQQEALYLAKSLAKDARTGLFVHDSDGRISDHKDFRDNTRK